MDVRLSEMQAVYLLLVLEDGRFPVEVFWVFVLTRSRF